jgi:hypothetical protein
MRFGSVVEHYLRWDRLPDNVITIPDDVLASNGARLGNKWKDWFAQQPDGATVLKASEKADELAKCQSIADQVDGHELARIATGRAMSVDARQSWWHHRYVFDVDDVSIKCEMDVFAPDRRVIADLKTSDETNAGSFVRKSMQFGYDVQAWVYSYAASLVCECDISEIDYVFVVVRSSPPYNVETYRATPEMIQLGQRKFDRYLKFWKDCADTGVYRSQTHGQLIDLRLPAWAIRQEIEQE